MLAKTIADVGKWEWTTVAVGVAGLVALFAFARFAPKLPGVIIVVALAIVASQALDLQDHGVAIVGDVPTGFHFVSLSSVSADDLVKMLPGALAIVIVGLAQALAIAKSYAAKYHYPSTRTARCSATAPRTSAPGRCRATPSPAGSRRPGRPSAAARNHPPPSS